MNFVEKLKDLFVRRRPVLTRRWDEHGLQASGGTTHVSIAWDQVRHVSAYKKDCYNVDQVRLLILSQDQGIEFTEDDPDFAGLCAFLSRKLGISDDWRLAVLLSPAFDETPTQVFPTGQVAEVKTESGT